MTPPVVRSLTSNVAATRPDHDDARLRGRTYSVPFDRVWRAALRFVERQARWTFLEADDEQGTIRAEARTLVFGFPGDITIHIRLDEDGQTRVDVRSESRTGKADFGMNARRIDKLLRSLDGELGVKPGRRGRKSWGQVPGSG